MFNNQFSPEQVTPRKYTQIHKQTQNQALSLIVQKLQAVFLVTVEFPIGADERNLVCDGLSDNKSIAWVLMVIIEGQFRVHLKVVLAYGYNLNVHLFYTGDYF